MSTLEDNHSAIFDKAQRQFGNFRLIATWQPVATHGICNGRLKALR